MWGEHSQQYATCREVAGGCLRARGADVGADLGLGLDLEDLMGRMGMLGVGDGDGDGDGGVGRGG